MTSKEILQADMLDILFENRNKEYGAYALRKYYEQRMGTALLIILLLIGAFSFFALSAKQKNNLTLFNPVVPGTVRIITIPPDVPAPPPPPPPVQPEQRERITASIKSTSIIQIVKDNDLTVTDVPDQLDLRDKLIDVVTVDGELPEFPNSVNHNRDIDGSGAAPTKPIEEVSKPFFKDEKNAEFPGGLTAFSRFLSKNLRTPGDLDEGEVKTVIANFKVDEYGKISEIVILKSAGDKFDCEVIRVLKRMPAWKPAMQNGHRIAIYFNQPVSFLGIK